MARSLTPDAIPLLEEAVHLLRRAPLTTLVCHFIGSAPFALALLLFWNDITNSRTSDLTLARDSVVLALLLAWLHCWRALFAGRLRRQLSATPEKPWNWRRMWNLFACQSLLGASKLVVMPLAILTLFGWAWTVAFYRCAAALADRDDLDPLQLIARARHLAGLDRMQSWLILPILIFLGIAFTLNLGLTLALLPQLVRMLTGYESQFSTSAYFIFTPLFLWAMLAISWMFFDPFVQAVYCLRSFWGESLTSGEDIRAGLRMLPAVLAVLLLWLPLHASAPVSQPQLQEAVKQAMRSSEYDWRLPLPPPPPKNSSWFVRATEKFIEGVKSVLHAIGKAIDSFVEWLRRLFGAPAGPAEKAFPSRGLHWSLYLLIALVIGVTAWIAWRRRWFRPPIAQPSGAPALEAIRLDADDLTADRLPEQSWLELAARSLREENFRFALRAYYLANLAWLGHSLFLTIHPGKTNREYATELRRKARAFAEARDLFSQNILAFERAWYGQHDVTAEDAEQFRQRLDRMKSALAAPRGAVA